jgi:aldose sugar dehydrogenase
LLISYNAYPISTSVEVELHTLYSIHAAIAEALVSWNLFRLSELLIFVLLLILSAISIVVGDYGYQVYGQEPEFRQREFTDEPGHPDIYDPNLHAEVVVEGLELPTTMAFLGPDDILVLEKEKGTVQRIVNGKMLPQPLLDVNVAGSIERCMCGIAVSGDEPGHTYVFLFYTEAQTADREDMTADPKAPLGNRLYRYELVDNKLVNPKMLLDLPADPGPRHNGGEVVIGPDNNLYITVGDVDGSFRGEQWQTITQNYQDGTEPDGRSGILRITQDGTPVPEGGILSNESPLNMYYAYGIRNSFGMDFDPITGNLWATENGPGNSDEINLVLRGFNSGWQEVMGMATLEEGFDPTDIVDFDGTGVYRDPKLVWTDTAGLTAIKFLHSERLGAQYQNDMFVGDVHNGRLYHFDLNQERTELVLPEALADKVIQTPTSPGLEAIIFGQGFAGITDVEVGPDGYLYVVSIGQGKIFKIIPGAPQSSPSPLSFPKVEQVPTTDIEEEPVPEEEEDEADVDDSDAGQDNGEAGGEENSVNGLFG